MGYTPLDDGLVFSTVNLNGGPTAVALWSLMMSTKDQDGVTNLTPEAVHRMWSESREPRTLDDVQSAWDYLAAPDPKSKNKEHDGRRIIPTADGHWLLVSSEKYREKHSGAAYRAKANARQARHRARLKARGDVSDVGGGAGVVADEGAGVAGPAMKPAPPRASDGAGVSEHRNDRAGSEAPAPSAPNSMDRGVDARDSTSAAAPDSRKHAPLGIETRGVAAAPVQSKGGDASAEVREVPGPRPHGADVPREPAAQPQAQAGLGLVPLRAGTLVSRACDAWNDRYGAASVQGGAVAGHLGILSRAGHDDEKILVAWRRYLHETTHPSPSPADFRSHFADWLPGGRGASRLVGAGGQPRPMGYTERAKLMDEIANRED